MMTRERRTVLFLWTVVGLLILLAFAVEASFRNQVCVSAMTVDQSGTTVYPEVCT